MLYNEDYKLFINKNIHTDYCIIDPPWSYDDKPPSLMTNQLTYSLWSNNREELNYIFNNLNTDYLFVWVTNSMLPLLCSFDGVNDFVYKITIPWIKLTSNESIFYGLGNSLRNCIEFLVLFSKKDATPLRLSDRNIIFEECKNRTLKPKIFERDLCNKLSKKGLKGVYIFSGGDLDFIDCVGIYDDCNNLKTVDLFT